MQVVLSIQRRSLLNILARLKGNNAFFVDFPYCGLVMVPPVSEGNGGPETPWKNVETQPRVISSAQ